MNCVVIAFLVLIIVAPVKTAASCFSNQQVLSRLEQAATGFFKSLQPNVCAQVFLNSTVRKTYLSDNLAGRVAPVGSFPTFLTAMEYWYGIGCSIPGVAPKQSFIQTVDILQLAYDARYYRVSFRIQINFSSSQKLIVFGILAFDSTFKLCGYNAILENAGLTYDIPANTYAATISNLCNGIQSVCRAYPQYTSVNDCISFLTATPFGSFAQADQNNVACRLIHIILAGLSPDIHCPHVGKTGGGFCTDKTAASYFPVKTDFLQCAQSCN